MKEFEKFWVDAKNEEIHAKPDQKLNIHTHGSNLNYINKLYGPLTACEVRVTMDEERSVWRVERAVYKQDPDDSPYVEWETMIEFDAQESLGD
ncbi:hypothetical protein [Paenibacillus polymyxa]|uniref:Uncharacterized protein n=1 Tax=Paenibacillus polymyxa (strain SC2) TaxID=886882 RepID=E3EL67_PAEPS|nr:hypothetical protein [Paenibacillus polymyxa]ADO59629.1 hypothetical protein PPSC2_26995 [Paenibacillus polymyxa SC2]WPQ59547.1 hypothetical protein SKN87_28195 [Paenibacillus polymyxa]